MRRALVIGIDAYPFGELHGCVEDARRVAEVLSCHHDGSPNFDVKLVTTAPGEPPISRRRVRHDVEELFARAADVVLLYFAGHGTAGNLGGYLVTPDAATYGDGVSLVDVLTLANASPADEAIVVLDSCHSGALGGLPAIANDRVVLREGVSILTACRADEPALEVSDGGVFTSLLVAALEGGAADVVGRITVASVYAYVDESLGPWDQRPLFKTCVSRLVPLRQTPPAIDLATLRELPTWFPDPHAELRLDPSFEPEAEPHDAENERVFRSLQRARAAKLVEPVGEEHMYYAALNGGACRLTALGRHYRRLVSDRRI